MDLTTCLERALAAELAIRNLNVAEFGRVLELNSRQAARNRLNQMARSTADLESTCNLLGWDVAAILDRARDIGQAPPEPVTVPPAPPAKPKKTEGSTNAAD